MAAKKNKKPSKKKSGIKRSPKKAPRKVAKKKVAKKAVGKPVKPKVRAAKPAKTTTSAPSLAGKPAPDFNMPLDNGNTAALKDLRGKRVVLYFYPKDDTPGCTAEACAFRDNLPKFNAAGAVVIGVSKDNVASHQKFRAKFRLTFPLAADTGRVCDAYGVWRQKSMYGRTYMGIERSTFIIDEAGVVRAEWRKVSVPGHAEEVIQTLASL